MASKNGDKNTDEHRAQKEAEEKAIDEIWWRMTPLDPSPLLQKYKEDQQTNLDTPTGDSRRKRQTKKKSKQKKECAVTHFDILKAKVAEHRVHLLVV